MAICSPSYTKRKRKVSSKALRIKFSFIIKRLGTYYTAQKVGVRLTGGGLSSGLDHH